MTILFGEFRVAFRIFIGFMIGPYAGIMKNLLALPLLTLALYSTYVDALLDHFSLQDVIFFALVSSTKR
jgi:hypothetical protein